MIKYVLFDFDGTLVDSREVFLSSYNQIATKYGFKKIEASNLDYLKNLSMMERFRFLKVPMWKLPFLTKQFLSLYRSDIGQIPLIEGIPETLASIREMRLNIGIVSSNSADTIKSYMEKKGIAGIAQVYCSSRLFGKDRILRKFLRVKNLKSNEVLYVCDELRDIIACNKVNIKPVWVSWGFELKDAVSKECNLLSADNTQELIAIIEQELLRSQTKASPS